MIWVFLASAIQMSPECAPIEQASELFVIDQRKQTTQQEKSDQQADKPELKPRERVVKAMGQGEDDRG